MNCSNSSIGFSRPQNTSETGESNPARLLAAALETEGLATSDAAIVPAVQSVAGAARPEATSRCAHGIVIDLTDRGLAANDKTHFWARSDQFPDAGCSKPNSRDIIGVNSGLRSVMHRVRLVAPTEATVLITGESGTGKELVAQAIHEGSARNRQALVKLNCVAVPESLFESEFFGHVKGSFTGALKDRPGRFELADGGTLFLDEIGDVPLPLQTKLLRVLQEQEFERIGDTRTRKVNVRVIAATNRDLKKEVEAGRFREDLYYRLNVFPIEVPPLRNRRGDIALLAAHFIRQSSRRMSLPEPGLTQNELNRLTSYDWPGNVRELQNVVERAIILSQGRPLEFELPVSRTIDHPRDDFDEATNTALPMRDELKRRERDAIISALKQTNGKVSGPRGAAQLLGMKPSTLASRIRALGVR